MPRLSRLLAAGPLPLAGCSHGLDYVTPSAEVTPAYTEQPPTNDNTEAYKTPDQRINVAGYNLGLIMRLLTGAGTPREFLSRSLAFTWLLASLEPDGDLIAAIGEQVATFAVAVRPRSAEIAFAQRPANPVATALRT